MRNNRLLPYETIVQATSGEPEAVGTVLQYYRRRIQCAARVNGRVLSEQTMQKYADLQRQTAQIDADKMNAAQQSVRAKYQDAAKKKLEDTFGKRYSLMRMVNSQRQVERLMKAKDDSEKKQERTKEKER